MINWFSCSGILASERATFLTPFVKLSVPAEGCSSVHFQRTLGREAADKLLKEGAKIDAQEALRIGEITDLFWYSFIPSYISDRICSRSCSALLLVSKVTDCSGELDQRGTKQNNTRPPGCGGVQDCKQEGVYSSCRLFSVLQFPKCTGEFPEEQGEKGS